MTIEVRCEQLSKSFRGVSAVREVSLRVPAGQVFALLGPSGCGKTTTLRLLAGFERPDEGRIEIGGRVVNGPGVFTPPEERRVGMVFQHYALFPHLSVFDNVAFGLVRGSGRPARVNEVLDMVGLTDHRARLPHELSGGEQQRVALARALAPRPGVLLLDEPFSGLDESLREQVRTDVRRILRESGVTALFVTHNQEEAFFLGDQVGVMTEGRLEQVAAPPDLFLAPATRFVAEFLGGSMFLPATVNPRCVETEIGCVLQQPDLPTGAAVDLVVRPDDLTLTPDERGAARVVTCQFRGDAYVYDVRLRSGRLVRCIGPHTAYHPPGTTVSVQLTPGHPLAVFPQE